MRISHESRKAGIKGLILSFTIFSFLLYAQNLIAEEEPPLEEEPAAELAEEKMEIKSVLILREGIDFSEGTQRLSNEEIQASPDYAVSHFLSGKAQKNKKEINIPLIRLELSVPQEIVRDHIFLKLYYYNDSGKLVGEQENPWISTQSSLAENKWEVEILPTLLKRNAKIYSYFGYDPEIVGPNFRVLVLFGTKGKMIAKAYPVGEPMNYDFDEKPLLETPDEADIQKAVAETDFSKFLIEKVIETKSEIHPRMTLFLLLPPGIKNLKEVKGVMLSSMFAGSNTWLRNTFLEAYEGTKSKRKLYNYMLSEKYAILGWAVRRTWVVGANFDTISKEEEEKSAKDFETVAVSWKKGVLDLCRKYHLPEKNFLITGLSAGSAWAHRAVLLYPELFLGAHIHVCGGYEMPTLPAKNVHWIITTGTKDGGLESSIKFYHKTREMGFPIVMKSEINLAHELSEKCEDFAVASFKYLIDKKRVFEEKNPNTELSDKFWEEIFKEYQNPPYLGNWETNESFPANEVDKIEKGKQMPILNEDIKEAWMGLKKQY